MVADPPSDWEIPMMYRQGRYDVGLDLDGRVIFWSTEVDLVKVIEAVTEVLVLKEKSPDEFQGNIIIRPSADISRDPGPEYNGSKCEEDSGDRSSSGKRHLQSIGGDQSNLLKSNLLSYPDQPQTIQEYGIRSSAQAQLEDATMVGECCPCMASRHSRIFPFKCIVCSRCTGWNSGE